MKSTSGLSIWPRNCRAYADSDSTYLRWPSAKIVSNARLDFPDPDSPVNTIMESRGRSSETSFRLCSRAPRTTSRSATLCPVLPVCMAKRGADHSPQSHRIRGVRQNRGLNFHRCRPAHEVSTNTNLGLRIPGKLLL